MDIIVPNCAPINGKKKKGKIMISNRHQASDPPHALSFFTNEKRPCGSKWLKKKITQDIEKVHGPRSTNPATARSVRTHSSDSMHQNAPETERRILAQRTSSRLGTRDKSLHKGERNRIEQAYQHRRRHPSCSVR